MIGVLAIGRLGNQLFQYAFALELESRFQSGFFIKDENHLHRFYADKYFDLAGFNRISNQYRVLKNRKYSIVNISSGNPAVENFEQCVNNHLYHGFYQSTEYFPSIMRERNNIFKPKKKVIEKFKKKNSKFFKFKNIVLHVRGTDYKKFSSYPLSQKYYEKALNSITDINQYQLHVVTDDFEYAKSVLPKFHHYNYIQGTEIEDFLKIMHADIAIIANSSFSWWAAFLNQKVNKLIFAPKRWLGTNEKPYPIGIINATGFQLI